MSRHGANAIIGASITLLVVANALLQNAPLFSLETQFVLVGVAALAVTSGVVGLFRSGQLQWLFPPRAKRKEFHWGGVILVLVLLTPVVVAVVYLLGRRK